MPLICQGQLSINEDTRPNIMPRVHCINRKWLEQRQMQACLNQAARIANGVLFSSDKSSSAHSPSAPAPSSRGTLLPLDHSIDLVRLERSGRQRAATKKRRLARHGKNATVITPRNFMACQACHKKKVKCCFAAGADACQQCIRRGVRCMLHASQQGRRNDIEILKLKCTH